MGTLQASHGLVADFSDQSGERTLIFVGQPLKLFVKLRLKSHHSLFQFV
jgi:hypothetical protein